MAAKKVNTSSFRSFLNSTMKDTLKKINKYMKDNGILYLWDSEDSLYDPDDIDIVSHDDGESYVDGKYTDEMNLVNLRSVLPEGFDEETDINLSCFTTRKKLDDFVSKGFDRLKRKQRIDYINDRKDTLRERISSIENELHYKSQELQKAKNELEDFVSEEKDMKKGDEY